jgi:hypothetical protein
MMIINVLARPHGKYQVRLVMNIELNIGNSGNEGPKKLALMDVGFSSSAGLHDQVNRRFPKMTIAVAATGVDGHRLKNWRSRG